MIKVKHFSIFRHLVDPDGGSVESLVGRERARRAQLRSDPARGGHHGAVRDPVLTRERRGGGEHQERGHVRDHDHLLPLPKVRSHDV